jgi:RNA polymerase sigma-70 factor (sigma-E family)
MMTPTTRTTCSEGTTVSRRDPQAFADFVAARSAALHRAAYLMVGDAQLAQDLVQEALTKTYVVWPRLRDPGAAEAYTRKAITTTAIGWYRKKSWGERAVDALPEPQRAGREDDIEQRAWLWQALQELPVRQRAAIVLRYYEDLTEPQTAEAMGCAVGTVKSQVSAGLKKLRARLGDDAEPLPHDLIEVTEVIEVLER